MAPAFLLSLVLQFICHSQLSALFSGSQAAFGTTFRGDKRKSESRGTCVLKRVTGKFFRISILFHRSKQKFYLGLSPQRGSKTCKKNHLHLYKSIYLTFGTFKKMHLMTLSLEHRVMVLNEKLTSKLFFREQKPKLSLF